METTDSWQWITDVGSGYSRMRPLDEGGMGTLYWAHKDSLDIDVVIKRVKQKFRGRMDERAEANILKNLKHKYLHYTHVLSNLNDIEKTFYLKAPLFCVVFLKGIELLCFSIYYFYHQFHD